MNINQESRIFATGANFPAFIEITSADKVTRQSYIVEHDGDEIVYKAHGTHEFPYIADCNGTMGQWCDDVSVAKQAAKYRAGMKQGR